MFMTKQKSKYMYELNPIIILLTYYDYSKSNAVYNMEKLVK